MTHQNPTRWYDRVAFLYDASIIGIYNRARKTTVEHLQLQPSQRVLDLACGTGENFRYVIPKIGASGILVGADYSEGMLAKARKKVERADWRNVHLMHADAQTITLDKIGAATGLPAEPFDAVLLTLGLTVIPDWEAAFERAWALLRPGGRIVLMDWQVPKGKWWAPLVDSIAASDITREWRGLLKTRVPDYQQEQLSPRTIYLTSGTKP